MTGESPSVPNFGLYQADDEYMDDSDILGQDSYAQLWSRINKLNELK